MKLNIDNPFFRAMSVLADVILLSVLWIVCSLPVVTAGAATLALYAVACKLAAGQGYRVFRDFFRALRRDFRQATAVWMPMLAAGAALVFDLLFARRLPAPWGALLTMLSVAGGLIWIAAMGWGFALLARFAYARGRDAMKNGVVLAACHPLATLAIVALALLPGALGLFFPDVFFYLLPVLALCGPGGGALGLALAVRPAFARMEGERGG